MLGTLHLSLYENRMFFQSPKGKIKLPVAPWCLVLHCASLLHTMFASLAHAHGRSRVQNVRDFPQTKLNSEINAPFLLNEHGHPHF